MATERPTGILEADILGQSPSHGGEVVAIGAASASSAALDVGTYRISATSDCWYKTGAAPTAAAATDGNAFLASGAIDHFTVHCADVDDMIAVIQDSAAGFLSITLCKADG